MSSIRRVNKTDAKNILRNSTSIADLILMDDYAELRDIDGIGPSKIDSLRACFKGPFQAKSRPNKQ